jgi:hypothetical protein
MALSPECRYAETDGSRSPQFAIRNSKWSGLLFRFSFWVGRLGRGAFAVAERSDDNSPAIYGWVMRPSNIKSREGRQNGSFVPDGTLEYCRPRVPAMNGWAIFDGAWTCRALRNSQFAIRNGQGFFSGIHFGIDDWGNWGLNCPSTN